MTFNLPLPRTLTTSQRSATSSDITEQEETLCGQGPWTFHRLLFAEGWILPTALLLEPSALESSATLPEPEGPLPWCQSTRLVVLS